MVDSVANTLLETLRDVLVDEVKFLSGVSDEVKKVERDLTTIHGLLMAADRKRSSDSPTLKICINELKELASKAENVLETYAVEVASKKEGRSLKKKLQRFIGILCECYSVHQVGNEIDGIRSQLADVTNKLQSINGGEGSSNAAHEERQRLLRLRFAHENEQHFVGMEKDIKDLVSMLLMDEPRIVSICGMGGLGKTTLARKVYHHQDVQGRFDGRAWVCVTQQFQAETILREIFEKVDNKRDIDMIKNMDYTVLVTKLYSAMEEKKWLIVIDDIWENDHWSMLKKAFPMNCKVVLTTRSENVAYDERHLKRLDFLSEDEGWELLWKIARPPVVESRSKSFEDKGKEIVHKCGGLPLAISVIGGILRDKQQIGEWEEVSSNIDVYLKRGKGTGNETGVKQVLDLSYDALPYYLKPCFLYLACFPEDHKINTEDLYLLWMAEGLISSVEKGNNESLRDVAERYLSELASRCMVQVEKPMLHTTYNKFISCRLHDLMHDLCSSKAEEEKFFKRIDISNFHHDIPPSIVASIHRIAVNNLDDGTTLCKSFMQEIQDLRSFLVVSEGWRDIHYKYNVMFENSKHLRVLRLNGFEFEGGRLPSTILKLIYLRYLSLRSCNVVKLPQLVCDLPYLHTLDLLVEIDDSLKLPNMIRKMKRLRHLFLPRMIEVTGGEQLRLDGLDALETLEGINSKTACITDIINLRNLHRLIVTIEEDMDSLSKILEYMCNNRCPLRHTMLTVTSCDFGRGEEGRKIVKNMLMSRSLILLLIENCKIGCGFPCYELGMGSNLVGLEIENSKIGGDIGIDVDVVEEFGKYPILQALVLEGEEVIVETQMRFGANSFPELEFLQIEGLLNIKKWEVEKGAMPKLKELRIAECRGLEKLPDGLRFIPTLELLRCDGMSEEMKGRMRRGGENGEGAGLDYANFSHIPNMDLD